jgi:hypothetical protein
MSLASSSPSRGPLLGEAVAFISSALWMVGKSRKGTKVFEREGEK